MEFKDKVVLITGGTSGIGEATAALFAKDQAKVIIVGRSPEKARRALDKFGPSAAHITYIQADIGDRIATESLFNRIKDEYGQLNIACNAAAISEVLGKPTGDWSEEEYDQQMGPNLKDVWRCMSLEIRLMLHSNGGSIVNISSMNGLGGAAGAALYSAAKHGVVGLTKSAALEYAKHKIRINALCAGMFRTPMLEHVFRSANPVHPEQVESMYTSLIPMGRVGTPEEAAEVIYWLCSNKSSYVTGHSMIADGGFTAMMR